MHGLMTRCRLSERKMSMDIDLTKLSDDELHDLLTDIINDREGVRDGTRRAERLDEWYLDVDNEIGKRERRTIA